ncbi:unnamed protein product [Lactuca saligna]|uniref:Ubiquitin-like protease family profile domain-containing protein n=1 Tax=Lactuca saligna TaxID=75948 RepID=A0AA36EFJ9_LACSI|nr:unnamed protein product [Lactuca saligna]
MEHPKNNQLPNKSMMSHLSVKASCRKLHEALSRLNGPVRDLFSTTSFGYSLDLPAQSEDGLLIHGLLLHMLRPTAETDTAERLYFRFSRCSRGGVIYGVKHTLNCREVNLGESLRSFRCSSGRGASTEKKKMIASDAEASTSHYLSYITSLNCESSEVPSSVRYNFRNDVRGIFVKNKLWKQPIFQVYKANSYGGNYQKTAREIMARLESLKEEIRGLKNKGGTRDGDDLEQFFNDTFEGNEDVVYSPQQSNRVNEDDHVVNPLEDDSRKQIADVKKNKKKKVVASDIVDAENHIPMPVVKEGRAVRQLKPSQYLSSRYVLVSSKCPRYRTGGVIHNEQPPPVFVSDPSSLLMEPYVNSGCNAPALYMGNKPTVFFLKHRLYNEKMEARFWDRIFYASEMGFLDEAAGSATGNPFDPLDGCKSWLEVDRVYFPICINPHHWVLGELWMDTLSLNFYDNFRLFGAVKIIHFFRFEELIDRILVEISYWNHMGRPIGISMATVVAATQFRYRMAMIYYGSSIQSILS